MNIYLYKKKTYKYKNYMHRKYTSTTKGKTYIFVTYNTGTTSNVNLRPPSRPSPDRTRVPPSRSNENTQKVHDPQNTNHTPNGEASTFDTVDQIAKAQKPRLAYRADVA